MDPEEEGTDSAQDLENRRLIVAQAMQTPEGRMVLGLSIADTIEAWLCRSIDGLRGGPEEWDTWRFVADHSIVISIQQLGGNAAYDVLDEATTIAGQEMVSAMRNHLLSWPLHGVVSVRSVFNDDPAHLTVGWHMVLTYAADATLSFVDITEEE